MKSTANREFRFAGVAFVVAVTHAVGCNSAGFNLVGARQLQLTDESGKCHGVVFATKTGSGLILRDGADRERVTLFAEGDKAGIYLRDAAGRERVRLQAEDDKAVIYTRDASGALRSIMGTTDSDGTSFVVLFDAKGNTKLLSVVRRDESKPASQEEIQRDAERLLGKIKSGWLDGLRELDKQGH